MIRLFKLMLGLMIIGLYYLLDLIFIERYINPILVIVLGFGVAILLLRGTRRKIFIKLFLTIVLLASTCLSYLVNHYFIVANFTYVAWSYCALELYDSLGNTR
jgi:hypothetical protein